MSHSARVPARPPFPPAPASPPAPEPRVHPEPPVERPRGVPADPTHAMAEGVVVSAAVAGAVVGAVAGPVGAVAGGAIGSAVGIFAGVTMEREAHAKDEHDRELDAAIGVTTGDLGTPEETKHPSPEVLADARAYDQMHEDK